VRIAKRAAMMAGRYAHAKQFNRHRRELRILRIRLGRIIRDIRRKIAGHADLEAVFPWPPAHAVLRGRQIPAKARRGTSGVVRGGAWPSCSYN
jgi:IS5 family transposase